MVSWLFLAVAIKSRTSRPRSVRFGKLHGNTDSLGARRSLGEVPGQTVDPDRRRLRHASARITASVSSLPASFRGNPGRQRVTAKNELSSSTIAKTRTAASGSLRSISQVASMPHYRHPEAQEERCGRRLALLVSRCGCRTWPVRARQYVFSLVPASSPRPSE